ncbi:MAG: J domain-containing protein [Chloroflexi bacterium]|nr:J domain-containing protein [Chloroflexota bacterium]
MTGPSKGRRDYYAVLQVDPRAEPEVIEAAYRRLIWKYHPDRAGDDPELGVEYEAIARELNAAHAVLRDPVQRQRYDAHRGIFGGYAAPPPGDVTRPTARAAAEPPHDWPPSPGESVILRPNPSLPGPLAVFSAAYYLLPGPYEWEEGSRRELLTVGMLPVAGVAAFALLTGRLTPLIGHSLTAMLVAWGLVVLVSLPMLTSLPRVAMAGAPSLVLFSGYAAPVLQQVHVPVWFAWGMVSLLSLLLAARLFVFGVLPTVAACWLVAQIT